MLWSGIGDNPEKHAVDPREVDRHRHSAHAVGCRQRLPDRNDARTGGAPRYHRTLDRRLRGEESELPIRGGDSHPSRLGRSEENSRHQRGDEQQCEHCRCENESTSLRLLRTIDDHGPRFRTATEIVEESAGRENLLSTGPCSPLSARAVTSPLASNSGDEAASVAPPASKYSNSRPVRPRLEV